VKSIPRVFVTPRAKHQIRTIDSWWSRERPSSPDLFLWELARWFTVLRAFPHVGRMCLGQGLEGVRRLLLRRTNHHVYYRLSGEQRIDVLAVWHAARGRPPDEAG
jgi:plasmid stabilization system protein ParE